MNNLECFGELFPSEENNPFPEIDFISDAYSSYSSSLDKTCFESHLHSPSAQTSEEASSDNSLPTSPTEQYFQFESQPENIFTQCSESQPQISPQPIFDQNLPIKEENSMIITQTESCSPQEKNKVVDTNMSGTKRSAPNTNKLASRSRKRRKVSASKSVEVETTADKEEPLMLLSRDDLLNFSSEQFEQFAKKLTNSRDLTNKEQNEIKRQRRLIKNRESAQASRERKKGYMDELEKRVQELTQENTTMKEAMEALRNENTKLKSDMTYFQTFANYPNAPGIFSRGVSLLANIGKQVVTVPSVIPSYTSNPLPSTKNPYQPNTQQMQTGLVLFVLLLSFGLFFNMAPMGSKQLSLPNSRPVGRILNHEEFKATSNKEELLDILSEEEFPRHRLERVYKRHLEKKQERDGIIKSLSGESVAPLSELLQKIEWQPNTTYLLCQNVSQLTPPQSSGALFTAQGSNDPPNITFVIPPDYTGTLNHQDNALSVTCNVIDVNVIPFTQSSLTSH